MCEFFLFSDSKLLKTVTERSDMMPDNKEIAQRALALAEKKAALKQKYLKIAVSAGGICAVFLFALITVYTLPLLYIFPESLDSVQNNFDGLVFNEFVEDNEIPLAGFFAVGSGYSKYSEYTVAGGELGITLSNPEANAYYLTFEIALAETGETLYRSYMVAPGLSIEGVSLSELPEAGGYNAELIIRAYDLQDFSEIKSEKSDLYLIFE